MGTVPALPKGQLKAGPFRHCCCASPSVFLIKMRVSLDSLPSPVVYVPRRLFGRISAVALGRREGDGDLDSGLMRFSSEDDRPLFVDQPIGFVPSRRYIGRDMGWSVFVICDAFRSGRELPSRFTSEIRNDQTELPICRPGCSAIVFGGIYQCLAGLVGNLWSARRAL